MTSRALPAALALAVLGCTLVGCSKDDSQATTSTSPAGGASCSYAGSGSPAKPVDPPNSENVASQGTTTATLTLDGKPVVLTLDRARTPCTTNSFVSLAQQKYFDDTSCHRLVDAGIFVLQCGDPTGSGSGGPGYAFNDELDTAQGFAKADAQGAVTYPKGTVAMANAGPGTNGSQFFLVWQDSPLPPAYTAFGTIDEAGLKTIEQIAGQGLEPLNGPNDGKPKAPAKISQVSLG